MLSLTKTIQELKKRHKHLYLVDVSSLIDEKNELTTEHMVVRPMTRSEFNFLTALENPDELAVEEAIKDCILYPDSITDSYSAGIIDYLYRCIDAISGFSSEASLAEGVHYGRNYATTLDSAITMCICKAFPKYTPEDVDAMTFHKMMELCGLAEIMLGIKINYDQYLHPEKYVKPVKKKKDKLPTPVNAHLSDQPLPKRNFQHSFVNTSAQAAKEQLGPNDLMKKMMEDAKEFEDG